MGGGTRNAVEVHSETADVAQDRRGEPAVERAHAASAEDLRGDRACGCDARLRVLREALLLFLLLGLDELDGRREQPAEQQ